ncbi:putative RNA helicase [Namao virus]|nr:putative RNA helicase [Namao virus]
MKKYLDILDSFGKKLNFVTQKEYSPEYLQLAKSWRTLPMYQEEKVTEFFNLLKKSTQVILVVSGTGSGKTVLIPKYMLYHNYQSADTAHFKIFVTNPKIITSVENAEYAAKTLDVELGKDIGIKYKGSNPAHCSKETKLIYGTDGILLSAILFGDKLLKNYNCIIIDEAHERQINIDLLFYFIKTILVKRPDFKLIIMSATVDESVFKDYYQPVCSYSTLNVSGKSYFDIAQTFCSQKVALANRLKHAVELSLEFVRNYQGDLIIFISTKKQAQQGCMMLQQAKEECSKDTAKEKLKDCLENIYCVEVFSGMPSDLKTMAISKEAYKTSGDYQRKVIFATNVAESSITFDGLACVIDIGLELKKIYDPLTNIDNIVESVISQAQVKQRIGRCGRTGPGYAFHVYSEDEYGQMPLFPKPSILEMDITRHLLQFVYFNFNLASTLELARSLISPPHPIQISASIYYLHFIDALKVYPVSNSDILYRPKDINYVNFNYQKPDIEIDGSLTLLGHVLLKLNEFSLMNRLCLIQGYVWNCFQDMTIIVAVLEACNLQMENLFIEDSWKEISFPHAHSDHLNMLFLYHHQKKYEALLQKNVWKSVQWYIERICQAWKKVGTKRKDGLLKKWKKTVAQRTDNTKKNTEQALASALRLNKFKILDKNTGKTLNFLQNSYFKWMPKSATTLKSIDQHSHGVLHELNQVEKNLIKPKWITLID